MKHHKMIKLFILFLFVLISPFVSAQDNVKDSIDWYLNENIEETAEVQYQYAERALVLAKEANLPKEEATVFIDMGIIRSQLGDYLTALNHFAEAKSLIDKHDFVDLKTAFYLEKTGVLRRLEHYEENIQHNEEAVEWFIQQQDTISLGLAYNNLGGIYHLQKNTDVAKRYFEKALATLKNTTRQNDGMIMSNLATVYQENKQYKQAITLFKNYLQELRKKDNPNLVHVGAMLINLGSTYGFLGDTTTAFSYYDTAMVLINQEKIKDYQFLILQAISETYELSGDYPNALKYYKDYEQLKNENIGQDTQEQIAEWKVKYESERKEKEIMNLQQAAKIKQQRYLLLTGVFILLALIGLFLFYKRASDFKKKKALHLTQQQLMESELKNKALEQERLQEQLAFKNKDLTNLTLDISRKNEFSNQLVQQLNDLVPYVPKTAKNHLNHIKLFVTNNLQINEELEVFQKNIEEINQDFYHKLLARFPNLTPKDTELCGLIKLNRTNKEIAAIKNISVSSAKMSRYRLRKKLGLESGENIVHFLRDF